MRVDELIFDLNSKFPRAKDWLISWSAVFRQTLGGREGVDLRHAYDSTLAKWAEPGCPKPAHFVANLPALPALPELDRPKHEMPWDKHDQRYRARARELEGTFTRDLAGWFETAKTEGWTGHLRWHVVGLAKWCAQCEQNGRTLDEAIARFNARDDRRNHPKRAPAEIVDEADAAIFRARKSSQDVAGRGRYSTACKVGPARGAAIGCEIGSLSNSQAQG